MNNELAHHLRHAEADLAMARGSVQRAQQCSSQSFEPILFDVAETIRATEHVLATIRRVDKPKLRVRAVRP